MLGIFQIQTLRTLAQKTGLWIAVAMLALAGISPLLLQSSAEAATLASRSVTISTSEPDAAGVSYDFSFTTATAGTIQSMTFEFCDTPLGTCTLPGTDGTPLATETMDVSHVTTAAGAFDGTTDTAFTEYTGADAGGCTGADGGSGVATMYCVTRTEATSEATGAKTFQITGITNPIIPAGNTEEVYIRVTTYSDTAFANAVDNGTVAAAIVNQLTVSGRVQERLVFCVFALEDAAGSSATIGTGAGERPTSCGATEASASTNVDIGVVDNLSIAKSPVENNPPSSLGNARFGAAMLNTNASNGVVITYYASDASTGTEELKAFRVPGATCVNGGASLVDQCFISADEDAGETFTAGTERFGLQIPCVNYESGTTTNLGADGTGNGTAGTFNTVYSNTDDDIADDANDDCENTDTGVKFGWNDDTTAQPLISSDTVVDDELVKINFGATANATTPTGTYTVASTYIATATF